MIQINDKLRVVKADERNLVIKELRTVESKKLGKHDEWYWCGYYSDLRSALCGVINQKLFDTVDEELQLKDLVKIITDSKNEILKAIGENNEN